MESIESKNKEKTEQNNKVSRGVGAIELSKRQTIEEEEERNRAKTIRVSETSVI